MQELRAFQHNPRIPPPLNLDVFGIICAFLTEYQDLLSLSLTSSALRPLAVRHLLRNRPVVLKRVDTISKFHDFILSDNSAHLDHLIALKVDVAYDEIVPQCSDRAIETLLTILQQAHSLLSLELLSSANGRPLGYLDDHRVSHAVGELATLRELKIGGMTETVDFIGAVRAPLTKLALHFKRPEGFGLKEWSLTSLCASLSHMAPSLEGLAVVGARVRLECDGPPPPDPLATFTGIQFHALRSLTLNSLVVVPNLALFVYLFPNLDGTLHLSPYVYDTPDSVDYDERYNTFFRVARERNGTVQERRSWKRLARLVCDIETLFILNLRCPIGLTIVHEGTPPVDPDVWPWLAESLRDHPSARLNLQASLFNGPEERSLGEMIPLEAGVTLTHITLCVKYDYDCRADPMPPEFRPVRWDDVWHDTLLPALEHMHSLTYLRLVFHCEAYCDYSRPIPDPDWTISQEPFLGDLRPTSGGFDFTAIASAIVAAVPSLRYCFLTNSAWVGALSSITTYSLVEQWRESRAWRIARVPPDHDRAESAGTVDTVTSSSTRRELVELDDDIAETIMEKEDLVLSEEEKTGVRWDD